MFSNNIKSLIILNIYFLVVTDILLLLGIYYEIIKDKVKNKHYIRVLNDLKPKVLAYINNEDELVELNKSLKTYFKRNVAMDLMLEHSEKNNIDISNKFINLQLDSMLVKKIKRKVSYESLRKLAFMRVGSSYETLLKLAMSKDLNISYISFYGLSLIKLPSDKKELVITKIITSAIISDRIIEVLNQFDLQFSKWLELLEKEDSVLGKVVFIKNIMTKGELKDEKNSDRILKFLKDETEVKIAAILALCKSGNVKYIGELVKVYNGEENWQVRVAIAKGLCNFKFEHVKEILLKMTKDKEWWVRYNAIRSIVAMGNEGLFSLIDLSLDDNDDSLADLAYYFLNSKKEVYDIVKDIRV